LSAATLVRKYDNLLVIQTTSKSRSLAGLRVGFALGNPSLIEGLIRIKDSVNSYTIDRLALVGAKAAFEDKNYFIETTKKIVSTREVVIKKMKQLGFKVLPSKANFIFASHEFHSASLIYENLKEQGVLVRYFNTLSIDNYLRITIGTDADMERFFAELLNILSNLEKS